MTIKAGPASGYARRSLVLRDGRLAAVLACVAALAAACGGLGGSSNPGYVNGAPTSALAFAQCMRAHGVPGFPDPSGGQFSLAGINQSSPQFRNAARICGGSSPGSAASQQAQGLAKGLEFARCMRTHGVRNFPDPVASNGNGIAISIRNSMGSGGGVDPNSPVFQAAMQACRPLLRAGVNPGGGNGGSPG